MRVYFMKHIHLGVIPDGNRRWARLRGLPISEGHRRGAEVMENFLRWCLEEEIEEISIYALSTENLQKRRREELEFLFRLFAERFNKLLKSDEIYQYEVRVNILGRYYSLPKPVVEAARKLMRVTRKHSKHFLNILVAYGSEDELTHCVRSLAKSGVRRITQSLIRKHLWVKRPLDLVIRTGGDHRLSNFMLYQAAYAELIFVDKYWPDFTREDFNWCLQKFYSAQRRMGGDGGSV